MIVRLALLLPEQDSRIRSKGSVYVAGVRATTEDLERSLYEDFLTKAMAWPDQRRDPQLRELVRLLKQAHLQGCAELQHVDEEDNKRGVRLEDEAFALPLHRHHGWEDDLPDDLQPHVDALRGLHALRLYCHMFGNNLILFDGNVKKENRVADAGSNVLTEFKQANRITRRLKDLAASGKLRNSGKTGRIDLNHLGTFEVADRD